LNSFLGMPSDGGMHAMAGGARSGSAGDNFTVNRGAVEGPRGGAAAGAAVTGPNDNTYARGAAVGPDGGVAAGRGVAGANGGGFAQGVAAGPDGRVAAGGVARGADGGVAARGVAAGDRGVVAGGAVAGERGAAAGFAYASPSARYGQAYSVRAGFVAGGIYTPNWYGAHPGAWVGAGLAASAWRAPTWYAVGGWFGTTTAPVDYSYGTTVVVQDNSVYVDGQPAGTTDEYYQQAATLATDGAQAPAPPDDEWLPLGVFAMTRADATNSNMVIQLAVNKAGVIRGNFTDTTSNQTQIVQGSIDKESQRAAWTIGDKAEDVMETGLYNLTKDEVPALLHYGSERTESWTLVRVKQDEQPAS
jgi:hypothetical protein